MDLSILSPMLAKNCPDNIVLEDVVMEEKFDGYRQIMVFGENGNKLYSRTLKENTDLLPHLAEYVRQEAAGTVIDGEIVSPTGKFEDLRGICGAGTLPKTAIENQKKKGWAIYKVFDMLFWKGVDIRRWPWYKRRLFLELFIQELQHPQIEVVPIYATKEAEYILTKLWQLPVNSSIQISIVSSHYDLVEQMWDMGKEGIIIKNIYGEYVPGKSNNFYKLKATKTYDVVITGYQPPAKEYKGKTDLAKWPYWEDEQGNIIIQPGYGLNKPCIPVTKPYALGYVGAVEFGVYRDGKLEKIGECRGLTDAICEQIKKDPEGFIGRVIEVKAQEICNKEKLSLRHPRFSRFRDDKNAIECTEESIMMG